MDKTVQISVRELVAFSYFPADILPAADNAVMLKGTKAHQLRQADSAGQVEKRIQHLFEMNGLNVLVYGRMDVWADGDVPLVEEIKLSGAQLEAPLAEHRAQAICYAAMLALEKPCQTVCVRVCYVNEAGEVFSQFDETLNACALEREMQLLLYPYVCFAKREKAHRQKRDESLHALPFPFEQYRKGQRELAVQVYTAIKRKRRLFASLPTGTGKSAAVLYPALKALGEGKTDKVLYLTSRGTARQSPLNALLRMQQMGLRARCCVLTAKEKLCPAMTRCHPDDCKRAQGHYIRQQAAIDVLLATDVLLWDENTISTLAEKHCICPFEFALALTELSDVVLMDVNYVFDPFAQIKRLQQRKSHCTLLVDEAHHLTERVRESLSGTMDSRELSRLRTAYGKAHGRKTPLYRALGALVQSLRACDVPEDNRLETAPAEIVDMVQRVLSCALEVPGNATAMEIIRLCLPFLYAAEHFDVDYAALLEGHGKERALVLYCLLPGKEIARLTRGMRGAVFFSATLNPLPAMKQLLGGGENDACFALPSPFPQTHLAVLRRSINTRYEQRSDSAASIAQAITQMTKAANGNCMVFFPSYAYMELVRSQLVDSELPRLWIQKRDMGDNNRAAFLEAFEQQIVPTLGLCVLGGLFSEGIDLPGNRLVGVLIVGVGLPVPSAKLDAIRDCYQSHFGDGFAYACRIPGMQKVLQAAGRVIRSETDRGVVMLLDERYTQPAYEALLPAEWQMTGESVTEAFARLEMEP